MRVDVRERARSKLPVLVIASEAEAGAVFGRSHSGSSMSLILACAREDSWVPQFGRRRGGLVARAPSLRSQGVPQSGPSGQGHVSYSIRAEEGAVDGRFDSGPSM